MHKSINKMQILMLNPNPMEKLKKSPKKVFLSRWKRKFSIFITVHQALVSNFVGVLVATVSTNLKSDLNSAFFTLSII